MSFVCSQQEKEEHQDIGQRLEQQRQWREHIKNLEIREQERQRQQRQREYQERERRRRIEETRIRNQHG